MNIINIIINIIVLILVIIVFAKIKNGEIFEFKSNRKRIEDIIKKNKPPN